MPRGGAADPAFDEALIAALLVGRIAAFKMPHRLMALDRLPKNANGKTRRAAVARIARKRPQLQHLA